MKEMNEFLGMWNFVAIFLYTIWNPRKLTKLSIICNALTALFSIQLARSMIVSICFITSSKSIPSNEFDSSLRKKNTISYQNISIYLYVFFHIFYISYIMYEIFMRNLCVNYINQLSEQYQLTWSLFKYVSWTSGS